MKSSPAALFAGLFLGIVALTTPAKADLLSLAGTFTGSATLTPTGTPGIFTESLSGTGTDGTFGNFTVSAMSTIDFSHPPSVNLSGGMIDLDFMGGSLGGTSSGNGHGNGAGVATFSGTFLVDDSTGVFAGFAGDVNITGTITQTSPTTADVSGSYSGNLATPEPMNLVLLGSVCLMIGIVGVRRKLRARS